MHLKHDADGKPIVRSNEYSILKKHVYEVEFSKDEMKDLTAKIITELMYS